MYRPFNPGPCPRRVGPQLSSCPFCYSNVKGRSNYLGHSAYRKVSKTLVYKWENVMKKPDSSPVHVPGSSACVDSAWLKRFPITCSYLCDGTWDDGTPRELSTISINFSQGNPTVGLSDHALQCSLYSTAGSVQDALDALEKVLKAGIGAWRPWKASKNRGK